MAQSLSFFGNRRGSTKSHTYQVNSGQQITKDRVDEVKNPRTNGQMVHRCCLHTLSDAHAYLRPFIGRFWEGALSPAASLAAFRKANYPILRAAAESGSTNFSFSPYKQTITPMGLLQISHGSAKLGTIRWTWARASNLRFGITANTPGSIGDTLKLRMASIGVTDGDSLWFIFAIKRRGDEKYIPVMVRRKFKIIPDELPSRDAWDECAYFEFFCSDPNMGFTETAGEFATFNIFDNLADFSQQSIFYTVVLEHVVNGRKTFSSQIFNARGNGYPNPKFPEAIATYPQGGGNVLDGGTI